MFLEIHKLKKIYGNEEHKVTVLKGISFTIDKGEISVVLGPSGSGKSTLLNLVGGIETMDGGEIIVDTQSIGKSGKKELAGYRRKQLGFVFQFYNLIPNLTVKENIEVNAYLSEDPLDMDELIKTLGLWEHRNKFPRQLSGGQQQRTSIGRALVKNPNLLLCDEPTGALDYSTSKEILQLLEKVNQKYRTTILLVTHNDAIREMAHQVLRLRDGEIVEITRNATPKAAAAIEW